MPGFTIHVAIAKQYLNKNKEKNEIKEQFIDGSIAPDLVKDKSISHYGFRSANPNLYDFLQKNDINNSYNRGYFLHLLTDLLFYHYLINVDEIIKRLTLKLWKESIYNDYDILNPILISKYNLEIIDRVSQYMTSSKKGKLKILNQEELFDFIDKVSSVNLEKIAKDIKSNDNEHIINLFLDNISIYSKI